MSSRTPARRLVERQPARENPAVTERQRAAEAAGLAVELEGVGRTFAAEGEPPVAAVENVDLRVAPGEFVALLGPSGCGKSTLLRMIAGLDRPDAGRVQLGGEANAETARAGKPVNDGGDARESGAVAYVFQDAHLVPWRDVRGNVGLPLELLGRPRPECERAATDAIGQVGLAEARHRRPAQLSGGMRMRASLARALVTRPRLLLLDEPFAALDEITRQELDQQLHQLWRDTGITVVFVTHSIGEATFLAQRAVVLSRRPARVVLEHTLDLPRKRGPELRTVPRFAGETGVLYQALRGGMD
jgi:NitT/TauT family transport system ATP-binding protein